MVVVCCWVKGSGVVVDGVVAGVVDIGGGGVVWKELVLLSKRLRTKAKSVTNEIVFC